MKSYSSFKDKIKEVETIQKSATTLVNSKSRTKRTRGHILIRGGIVLLSGHLEGYLRNVLEDYIEQVNDKGLTVNNLEAGLVLNQLAGSLKNFDFSNKTNCESLFSSVSGSTPFALDVKHFNKTESNPTVDKINSMLNKVGIIDIVFELTQRDFNEIPIIKESACDAAFKTKLRNFLTNQPSVSNGVEDLISGIQILIDQKWTPKKKTRDVGYIAVIQKLLHLRNRIAHGDDPPQITDVELSDFITDVKRLALGINTKLNHKLRRYR